MALDLFKCHSRLLRINQAELRIANRPISVGMMIKTVPLYPSFRINLELLDAMKRLFIFTIVSSMH